MQPSFKFGIVGPVVSIVVSNPNRPASSAGRSCLDRLLRDGVGFDETTEFRLRQLPAPADANHGQGAAEMGVAQGRVAEA